jgi:hypothetical protein
MDFLQLRVLLDGSVSRVVSAEFIDRQFQKMMTERKDDSYRLHDWAFKLHTLAEWLNTKNIQVDLLTDLTKDQPLPIDAQSLPKFYLWNTLASRIVDLTKFGNSK